MKKVSLYTPIHMYMFPFIHMYICIFFLYSYVCVCLLSSRLGLTVCEWWLSFKGIDTLYHCPFIGVGPFFSRILSRASFLVAQTVKKKEKICLQCERPGFNPWVWKIPCRRALQPLQCSHLGNPMDKGAWQTTVHGVTQSWTQLKRLSVNISISCIEGLPWWLRW